MSRPTRSAQRVFTVAEAYNIIASDSETDYDSEEEYVPFLLPSSSSSSSSSDEEPRQRRRRTLPEPAPQPSEPVWTPVPESYEAQIPGFVANSGIQFNTDGLTEIDYFKYFFSDELVNLIVEQTNLYAQQFLAQNNTSSFSNWTPVTSNEMLKFWGLVLHMGIVKKPETRQYWSADMLYHTPLYSNTMLRKRFEAILKFLHYNDNAQCPPPNDPSFDRLYKLRPILDHFAAKFSEAYIPEKNICVDESLVHFKGRLKFRQYLPNKRARYGIKLYKLCESISGYTLKFRVYEGKDSVIEPPECPPSLSVSGKIVWDMVYPLLDKGYHLYMDNFYSSLPLFQCLAARATVACGTIRKNQRGLPKTHIAQPLPRGESRALCSNNILLLKYKDKRDVLILTSIHGSGSTTVPVRGTSSTVSKPDCILDYNKNMGGVDLSDQVLKPYSAMRKTKVWYKKLVVHIVQMALYNAYVLSCNAGGTGTFLEFQETVIKALISGDREEESPSTSSAAYNRIVPGQHFPNVIPPTGKKGKEPEEM
ncbi:piggyBac transposable element-derived protein 4-like [Hyla sarda]|uniref:piggyBac transposable element-derived protein 4-like n=1 Tax=Hyla sarda TaxID=327740 RepID=UPI0024C3A663|nr:piggyBac transposable element-derived protein 4-like [Hyla sarda]